MMALRAFWLLLLLTCCNDAAKILGIFPTPSYSHQKLFQTIMKALVKRGHEITVIGTDPLKESIVNYTDVDLSFSYKFHRARHDFEGMVTQTPYEFAISQIYIQAKLSDHQLSSPQLQEFIRSNKKYDLVLLEEFLYHSYNGLIHHVGSPPVIGIAPFLFTMTPSDSFAIPDFPSYVPNLLSDFDDNMSFFERLENTILYLYVRYISHTALLPENEKVMRKHFGDAPPSIAEAHCNKSLLLVGSNWLFRYPLPLPPSIVTFQSAIIDVSNPLPKDIQEFMDAAPNGVIYMNFGTNVHSAHIPKEKIKVFLDAFSQLPQKILWKWESEIVPVKTPNIKFKKWFPQQDVLAHHNVKLFITHCGLQSMQEAVYNAVPMLALPFFGDQKFNAKKVHKSKIGLQMSVIDISKDTLLNAINKIIHDSRENVRRFSTFSKDTPQNPVEKAVWWIEYVFRHKGAKHLRTAAVDLTWYQLYLLDVMAFLIFSVAFLMWLFFFLIRRIYCYFYINIMKKKI